MALNIPETIAVVIESYPLFGEGTLRIEARQATGTGQFADFGEVAYWHTDGENDIMKGEKGTLDETIQALVDFTLQN
jgi:hypothetical protein